MNLDERAVTALEQIAGNYPKADDVFLFEAATNVVMAGTSLTIRWIVRPDFTIWLTELYADARAGVTYVWDFGGTTVRFNLVDYTPFAREMPKMSFIELVISNPTVANVEIGYHIRGFSRMVLR